MLLALDTSTRFASVALYDEGGVIGESTWFAHENHTTSLMPQLMQLVELSGVKSELIKAVAVGTGPGSFTGLRIGMSIAKGIALARGIPLIGVFTLDGMAQAFVRHTRMIWAVLQVGRGRFGAAPYKSGGPLVRRSAECVIGGAETIAEAMLTVTDKKAASEEMPALVCGEIDEKLRSEVLKTMAGQVEFANPAGNLRRAGYLAEIGWARWQTNDVSDLESLAPYYVSTASLPQVSVS